MHNDEEETVVEPGEQGPTNLTIILDVDPSGEVTFAANQQISSIDLHFYLMVAAQKVLIAHLGHVQRLQQLQKNLHVPQSPGLIIP